MVIKLKKPLGLDVSPSLLARAVNQHRRHAQGTFVVSQGLWVVK
jgi:hypothetical protein